MMCHTFVPLVFVRVLGHVCRPLPLSGFRPFRFSHSGTTPFAKRCRSLRRLHIPKQTFDTKEVQNLLRPRVSRWELFRALLDAPQSVRKCKLALDPTRQQCTFGSIAAYRSDKTARAPFHSLPCSSSPILKYRRGNPDWRERTEDCHCFYWNCNCQTLYFCERMFSSINV